MAMKPTNFLDDIPFAINPLFEPIPKPDLNVKDYDLTRVSRLLQSPQFDLSYERNLLKIDDRVTANSTVNRQINEVKSNNPKIQAQTQPPQRNNTQPLTIPAVSNTLSSKSFSSTSNFFAANPFYGTPLIPTKTTSEQSPNLSVTQNTQLKSNSLTGSNKNDLCKLGDLLCESTLDPFNDCELKTLNDIEELKKILENNLNGSFNNLATTQSSLYQNNHVKPDVKFNIEK